MGRSCDQSATIFGSQNCAPNLLRGGRIRPSQRTRTMCYSTVTRLDDASAKLLMARGVREGDASLHLEGVRALADARSKCPRARSGGALQVTRVSYSDFTKHAPRSLFGRRRQVDPQRTRPLRRAPNRAATTPVRNNSPGRGQVFQRRTSRRADWRPR